MKLRNLIFLLPLLFFACRTTAPTGVATPTATSAVALVETVPVHTSVPTPASTSATAELGKTTEATATLPPPTPTLPPPTPTAQRLLFAVIGDYGEGNQGEQDVANLVKSWKPDLIITVGDNNYPSGAAGTIDNRIGQYYSDYIFPYEGAFSPGGSVNRFYPVLGNHDLDTAGGQAYYDYFTLPGNERYYDFAAGPVHFFALNSDSREPDGVGRSSLQAQWLQARLAASTEPWQIVYFHVPPYSSGYHGAVTWMRWPFAAWGADAVFYGHDHNYERLLVDGIPYFTDGLGGGPIYPMGSLDPHSQARYNADYGALVAIADLQQIVFQFYTRTGQLIDTYTITRSPAQ